LRGRGQDRRDHGVERWRLVERQFEQAELDRPGEELGVDAVGEDDEAEPGVGEVGDLAAEAEVPPLCQSSR
jgi:hypothetical protein